MASDILSASAPTPGLYLGGPHFTVHFLYLMPRRDRRRGSPSLPVRYIYPTTFNIFQCSKVETKSFQRVGYTEIRYIIFMSYYSGCTESCTQELNAMQQWETQHENGRMPRFQNDPEKGVQLGIGTKRISFTMLQPNWIKHFRSSILVHFNRRIEASGR